MKRTDDTQNEVSYHEKKKQNQKHAFILLWLCMGVMGLLLFSGCANGCQLKCGQVPEHKSGTVSMGDGAEMEANYISIPACGGCITSGWGCGSCLWGENCVFVSLKATDGDAKITEAGCGEMYYGNSCGGCGTSEDNVYMGVQVSNSGIGGIYFGDSAYNPIYGSCQCAYGIFDDGCKCGSDEDGEFATFLSDAKEVVDYIDELSEVQERDKS